MAGRDKGVDRDDPETYWTPRVPTHLLGTLGSLKVSREDSYLGPRPWSFLSRVSELC